MMDMTDFVALASACAPLVHRDTAAAIVATESGFNPYAIGVVGGALVRQPRNAREAVATARTLRATGWNFSVGLAQINAGNFERLGLDLQSAFEPCRNLGAMQRVLVDCFDRAAVRQGSSQQSLRQALSCYYSGDFKTGYDHGYVRRVVRAVPPAVPPRNPLPIPSTTRP